MNVCLFADLVYTVVAGQISMRISLSVGLGGWAWCSAGRKYATVTSRDITERFSSVRTTVMMGSVIPR